MFRFEKTAVAVTMTALVSLASSSLFACGAWFPNQLLDDRAATLGGLPEGNFYYEMRRFGVLQPGLSKVTDATSNPNAYYWDSIDDEPADSEQAQRRAAYEQKSLSSEHGLTVKTMRSMTDARAAEQAGAALSDEVRWYTAGAVAYANNEDALAGEYFRRVLALPEAERTTRSTWAQYSLALTLARGAEPAQAIAMFTDLRNAVAKGAADPLELAVASLGEQARIAMGEGDWSSAVHLYASQLAHDSDGGYASLLVVGEAMLALPDVELANALQSGVVQHFLASYLFSRVGYDHDNMARVARLFAALTRVETGSLDQLAAASYQYGDYASSARFLDHAGDSGLAWWLRAKLALRSGDKTAAQAAYAKAAKAFPIDQAWGNYDDYSGNHETTNPRCRVNAESAILALERGDYLDALDLMMQGAQFYWLDAALIAERVLTVDELKAFVEQHSYADQLRKESANSAAETVPTNIEAEESHVWGKPNHHQLLRELLARRLLRANRYDEALEFFATRQRREIAEQYSTARKQMTTRWTAVGRAQAAFEAGRLLRQSGMELMGYEMAPDYFSIGGMGAWEQTPQRSEWLTSAELTRHQQSQAEPDKRYHYRYVAVNLVNNAADLLSPRSQAFAATLCHATMWVTNRDPELAQRLYQRYVDDGPYQGWAKDFGQHCPEPDFTAAQKRQWQELAVSMRQMLRPYKWGIVLFGLGLLAAITALFFRRRQKESTKG